MKKILLTVAIAVATLTQSVAQISQYQHPCSILGQEEIKIKEGEQFELTTKSLIIHDVDDHRENPHTLKILKKGSKSKGNIITPAKGFNGDMYVDVQISDGKFDSEVYKVKITVGEPKLPTNILYVAPNGDDSNSGSIDKPIKTLQKAKELAKIKKINLIYFREGDYFMNKSVVFTAEDSGSETAPITYMAYPGESVRFTGSVALPYDKFEKATPDQVKVIENNYVKAKIKTIDLKAMGITDYGELANIGYGVKGSPLAPAKLYIDGAAQNLARYPNVGNFADVSKPVEKNQFTSISKIVNKWQQTGDLWIDGAISKAWEWQKNRIESIDEDGTVKLSWDYHSKVLAKSDKMFYFNILEELDAPDEYYIDRSSGLLYVMFASSVNRKSDIRLTQSRENIITLSGANYLVFKNITIEGSRNGAINTTKPSSYNTIEGCTIYACGESGIRINGSGNMVRNCYIHNVGASGVNITGGDYTNITHARNTVDNCEIHDFSQERRVYTAGLALSGVGQIVRHVKLYNGPHMSVRISGVDHIMEYCDLYNAPCEYSDMLGVYLCTGGRFFDRGTIIRRNKFHDVNGTWKQSAGVYLDNETNGVVVEENYFFDNYAEQSGWSVMVHGGADNSVRRNVFVDCSYPFAISTRLNGYAQDRVKGILTNWEKQVEKSMNNKWLTSYPELRHYFYDGDKEYKEMRFNHMEFNEKGFVSNYWNIRSPTSNQFYDNLVYNHDQSIFALNKENAKGTLRNHGFYTESNYKMVDGVMTECLIKRNNHNVEQDPGFVDYKGHNLRVKSGAEILKLLPHLSDEYYERIGLKVE